ncbi:MAG: 3'-5' exonuclease [Ruminococcus sp.]|nr:3'-5' exonuclease [Ruminococcus sp.]
MSYVILDLEWNGSYSKSQKRYINEIIEFGAVKTDDDFNIIDRFSMLITPQIGKKLCNKVKELTKITNEELEASGVTFMHAVSKFTKFSQDSVLLTWSTSDIHALIENYSYYTHEIRLPFLNKYCNLQKYCERCLGTENPAAQLGLGTCAQLLSIEFSEEEQHRAFSDAELSLKCLKYFISDYSIEPFIIDASKSAFYDRIMFRNHYITDINSPDIDKSQMIFSCDECGCLAEQKSKWKVRNKHFAADFECPDCGKKFSGRVAFKRKFEGVIVKKKIYVPKPAPNAETQNENKETEVKN